MAGTNGLLPTDQRLAITLIAMFSQTPTWLRYIDTLGLREGMTTSFAHAASRRQILLTDRTGGNAMTSAQLVLRMYSIKER